MILRYFEVIAGKVPNILTGRGMLCRGYVISVQPDVYPRHADLLAKMLASPRRWKEFFPEPEPEAESAPAPKPTDGLLPHQVEAIKRYQEAISNPFS